MDIARKIKSAGELVGDGVYKTKCQGCGKEIRSDEDLSDVEYVETKRRSKLFFHRACSYKVWKRGIV